MSWQKIVKAPEANTNPPIIPMPRPVVQTTPVKTPAGWKTYENKELGFAFDYPGGWKVEEGKGTNDAGNSYEVIKIMPQGMTYELISLNIYNNPKKLNLADYFSIMYDNKGGVSIDPRAPEYRMSKNLKASNKVSGVPSFLFKDKDFKIVVFSQDTKVFRFLTYPFDRFGSENFFDKILVNFRFILNPQDHH